MRIHALTVPIAAIRQLMTRVMKRRRAPAASVVISCTSTVQLPIFAFRKSKANGLPIVREVDRSAARFWHGDDKTRTRLAGAGRQGAWDAAEGRRSLGSSWPNRPSLVVTSRAIRQGSSASLAPYARALPAPEAKAGPSASWGTRQIAQVPAQFLRRCAG